MKYEAWLVVKDENVPYRLICRCSTKEQALDVAWIAWSSLPLRERITTSGAIMTNQDAAPIVYYEATAAEIMTYYYCERLKETGE